MLPSNYVAMVLGYVSKSFGWSEGGIIHGRAAWKSYQGGWDTEVLGYTSMRENKSLYERL